jgi:hypothetical protein
MATPFDTLKLARRLETAGFPHQQAGDMSEAIAEAVANLATKGDLTTGLNSLEQRLIIRLGGLITLATGVMVAIKYFG